MLAVDLLWNRYTLRLLNSSGNVSLPCFLLLAGLAVQAHPERHDRTTNHTLYYCRSADAISIKEINTARYITKIFDDFGRVKNRFPCKFNTSRREEYHLNKTPNLSTIETKDRSSDHTQYIETSSLESRCKKGFSTSCLRRLTCDISGCHP